MKGKNQEPDGRAQHPEIRFRNVAHFSLDLTGDSEGHLTLRFHQPLQGREGAVCFP